MGAAASAGPGSAIKDRYLSRLIIWMNTQSPICYRDIRVNITGMATMLANVLDNQPLLNQFVEMLRGRLVAGLDERAGGPELRPAAGSPHHGGDREASSRSRASAMGVERALYELDPLIPCRSPMIADFYVIQHERPAAGDRRGAAGPGRRHHPDRPPRRGLHRRASAALDRPRAQRHRAGARRKPTAASPSCACSRWSSSPIPTASCRGWPRRSSPCWRRRSTASITPPPAPDAERRMQQARQGLRLRGAGAAVRSAAARIAVPTAWASPPRKRAFVSLKREERWLEKGGLTHPDRDPADRPAGGRHHLRLRRQRGDRGL